MKKEEEFIILRDRAYMLSPVYWNNIIQTSPKLIRIYGKALSFSWTKFYKDKNGVRRGVSFYPKNNFDFVARYIAKRIFADEKYFLKIKEGAEKSRINIIEFIEEIEKKDFLKLGDQSLLSLAKKIQSRWIEYDLWTVPGWFIAGDKFKELAKNKLSLPDDDFLFLSDPLEKTHASKMEEEILAATICILNKPSRMEEISSKLSKDFGWIPFGYIGPEYWDSQYFRSRLREKTKIKKEILTKKIKDFKMADEAKRNKFEVLLKKYKISGENRRLISIMHDLAVWTDERKALDYRLHYYYAQILSELGRRMGISLINLQHLLLEEIILWKGDTNRLYRISENRMNNIFVIEYSSGKGGVMSKQKASKILRELDAQERKKSEIRGMIACRGPKETYCGKVKILSSAKENDKIKKGEFLVATMTTPDYILAMRKAAGFITDEGGVTCHAAIVAREMNKPCIIGTRNATKVLKDGDLIEVDANNGVVKIFKKYEKDK